MIPCWRIQNTTFNQWHSLWVHHTPGIHCRIQQKQERSCENSKMIRPLPSRNSCLPRFSSYHSVSSGVGVQVSSIVQVGRRASQTNSACIAMITSIHQNHRIFFKENNQVSINLNNEPSIRTCKVTRQD